MTTELKLNQTLKQVISDSLYLSEDKTVELKRDQVSMIWELRIEGKLIDRSQYRHDPRDVTTVAGSIVDALPEFAKDLKCESVFLPSHIVRFTPLAEGSGQFLTVVERRHNDYATIGYAIVDRGDAAARTERNGLRTQLAAATVQLPVASCTSVREYATTLTGLFDQCAGAFEGMAREAAGHASDSRLMQEAWPK